MHRHGQSRRVDQDRARYEVRNVRSVETSLEEIFLAYYGSDEAADTNAGRRRAMLLRNVFTKTIRDLRWPTFWVSLGCGAMTAYFATLFPTYSKLFDMNALLEKMDRP